MQAAFHSLLTLAIVWGLPVYLLDRRARYNDRPGWMRFAIAFFMLFYFLIVPIFMAFALAGPKRPRRSRRPTGFLADHPPFVERYDPRPSYDPPPEPYTAQVAEYDRHSPEASTKRLEEHQLALARRRREEAEARQRREPEPSRHSQTRPYLTPQQQAARRREQHDLDRDTRRRERQQQQAREKQERQDRADRQRQAQNDLFMTWDERGEEDLAD